MIKIGLIGEDPYDTQAIKNLMKKKFDDGFHYFTLSKNQTGTKMFNDTAVRSYNQKIKKENPQHIIVIIDADAIITQQMEINAKQEKYRKLKQKLNCNSLLLLNIYELEALILADIDTFNEYYQPKINFTGNVMHKEDPKGFLISKTHGNKKYQPSHCPGLFKLLNFDTIKNNCAYFKTFITDFEKAIEN